MLGLLTSETSNAELPAQLPLCEIISLLVGLVD